MPTTLADVARLSATSRSTASRALKNDPRISAETAERVRLVAEALDYKPNMAARSLSTGRSGIVGLVLPTDQLTGDPYGAQVVSAITSASMASEHAVMLWLSHQRPGTAVQAVLRGGLVDGLVVSITAQSDPWVESLLDSGIPCVLIGRHSSRPGLSYATIDNASGSAALMGHVLEQGFRRIAIVRGPLGNADADERYAAYVAGMGGESAVDANLVAEGDFTYDSGYQAAGRLLRHRPDCIVAANDHMALGVIDALADAGLSVPHDVGVTGWDDMRELRRPLVSLTTVRQDIQAVGREAVGILLEILGGASEPIQRVLPTSLVARSSTLRVPAPASGGS